MLKVWKSSKMNIGKKGGDYDVYCGVWEDYRNQWKKCGG
jgi:hypothetical protein